jgi:hypothetical protein
MCTAFRRMSSRYVTMEQGDWSSVGVTQFHSTFTQSVPGGSYQTFGECSSLQSESKQSNIAVMDVKPEANIVVRRSVQFSACW